METTTEHTEEQSLVECVDCGSSVDREAEGYTAKDGEICDDCYNQRCDVCVLCGDSGLPEDFTSQFIVMKTEAARTCSRPPGIYRVIRHPIYTGCIVGTGWMHADAMAFVDRLPAPDETYDISGHICHGCAKKLDLEAKYSAAYPLGTKGHYHKASWLREKRHTRRVILEHPDMLRDLECDTTTRDESGNYLHYSDDSHWKDLQRLYDLPDGLPTFHEWVFVEHKGVKIYYAGYKSDDSWMTWHPEPRFRTNGHGPDVFACCSLPTHKPIARKMAADAIRRRRADNLEYQGKRGKPFYRIEPYDYRKQAARPAVIAAIDAGILTQNGPIHPDGSRMHCR